MRTRQFFTTLILALAGFVSHAQVGLGSFDDLRGKRSFVPPLYCDTVAANTGGAARPNSLISTYCSGTKIWIRNKANTTWETFEAAISGGNGGMDTAYVKHGVVDTLVGVKNGTVFNIATFYRKTGLLEGGMVTYAGTPLTYFVKAAVFSIGDYTYVTNDTMITLPALANVDSLRTDVFIVNTTPETTTIQGVESANPLEPSVDPAGEVRLTSVTLSSSNPSGVSQEIIVHDEDDPSEFAGTASGLTVNFASTSLPYRGANGVETGPINNNDLITFTYSTTIDWHSVNGLSLFLRLKAAMPSNNNIMVRFFNGATAVSGETSLPLTKTNASGYQGLSLYMSDFGFTANEFNTIQFRYAGAGAGITGIYMDYIYLQSGITGGGNSGQFVSNVYARGDSLFQLINGAEQFITLINQGSGGGAWGSITGTLSDQTDLQAALDAKEAVANKATDFSTLNHTLYPTTQAIATYLAAQGYLTSISGIAAGGDLTGTYPNPTIATNAVSNAKLAQMAGLSVKGNATNSTANASDIVAASDHQVMRRSGTAIGFGSINLASSNAVTGLLADGNISSASTWNSKEPGLGNPSTNGYVLSSTTSGVRSWIAMTGGGTPLDSIAIKKIPSNDAGTFHYVGFNSGRGGLGQIGGRVLDFAGDDAVGNVLLGKDAGYSIAENYNGASYPENTFLIGNHAGRWITTGNSNLAIGNKTLGGNNTSVSDSIHSTGSATYGTSNIALGNLALGKLRGTSSYITAIGQGALANLTNPINPSTAIGYNVGSAVTTGGGNTFVGLNIAGSSALASATAIGNSANVTGDFGVAIGNTATAASRSAAVGNGTLAGGNSFVFGEASGNSTASNMVAISRYAHSNNTSNDNITIGRGSLGFSSSRAGGTKNMILWGATNQFHVQERYGSNNVIMGWMAGNNDSTGSVITKGMSGNNNVFIGYYAAKNQRSGSNNVVIGDNVEIPNPTGGEQIAIGTNGINYFTKFTTDNILVNLSGSAISTPTASSAFEINSPNKGLLIPRMSSTARGSIVSPATGLIVYDTDINALYWHNGTIWRRIGARPYTPSSTADSAGNVGDEAYDDNYHYIKTSAGWKRTALSTF